MSKDRASVEVTLDGTDVAVSNAKRLDQAFERWGHSAASGARAVGGSLASMAGSVIKTGLAIQGGLSLMSAIDQAKHLDETTAKLGQSAKTSGNELQEAFKRAEQRTLTSAGAQAEFAKQLGRTTYDSKFAAEAVSAMAEEALASGRELGEGLPFAAALSDLGVRAQDVMPELDRVRAMAEQVGTVGGHLALKDTLAALRPELQTVAADSDEARGRLEALVAVLGKGLKAPQAQAVGSSALSMVKQRALDIERLTGRRVLDNNGQVIDPTRALADVKRITQRKFGSNQEAQRRALISEFGADLGLAIFRTDFSEVNQVAKAKGSGKTAAEAQKFRDSKEGGRISRRLTIESTARDVAGKALGAADEALGGGTGPDGKRQPGVGDLVQRWVSDSSSLGADLASSAREGFSLSGIPWRKAVTTDAGKEWRSQHADTVGKELAAQAMSAGDLTSAYGKTGGDPAVVDAMLGTLQAMLLQQQSTNALLKDQVAAGIAERLQRTPLMIRQQAPANKEGGN